MPAFNEASCIRASIAAVKQEVGAVCSDYEIIVVNDGSTDGTRAVLESLEDDKVRVIGYDSNKGKGHALKKGFNCVTGEFSFFIDSDLEIKAREFRVYAKALETADIVIGSKRHPLSVVQTPVMRRFLSLGFNTIERVLTGVRASDTQAGMKCAKSSALYRILPLLSVKKYAFDVELLAVASLLDLKIRELPVYIHLRASFRAREVFRMLVDVLGISYRLRVKRWYQKNLAKMLDTYKPIISW